uniref:Glucagon receptor n=1 Tax=Sander lucioperca TaxID=283035 RepID=A0A8D0AGC2_SANLU
VVVCLFVCVKCVSGRTVKDTVEEWNRYRKECLLQMSTEPRPKGVFCGRMFDMYACWSDGKPNSTVKVPCPWYLPWYNQVRNGFVLRECGPDGQWTTSNSSHTWRDHSQCNIDSQPEAQKQMLILAYFRVMYTVGYCVSLASLSLALIILLFFRKLHCTRNYIHTNLFASFILRAVSILSRDALLDLKCKNNPITHQAVSGCRVAQVLMQYCVGANYYWLLVEGLYLHNLLGMMVFSENRYFFGYLLTGWGNDTEVVNFFIFIRIIQILVSKLRAHQMRYTDYKFRLAKSTLTLIPLLGIHEVVFAVLTEEHTDGILPNINLFFQLFFNSFQGLLVAVLYCFINKEVQAEIKKKWQRWKLGMTDLDDLRNTGSNTPQASCLSAPPNPSAPPHTQLPLPHPYTHHQDQLGARQLKTYCYIPAHTQSGGGGGGNEEKSCESYC